MTDPNPALAELLRTGAREMRERADKLDADADGLFGASAIAAITSDGAADQGLVLHRTFTDRGFSAEDIGCIATAFLAAALVNLPRHLATDMAAGLITEMAPLARLETARAGRVTELLEANNREVDRRRDAERKHDELRVLVDSIDATHMWIDEVRQKIKNSARPLKRRFKL